jgi:hypothetical protein
MRMRDVNSIGGGEKPSLHTIGPAISLVGGGLLTSDGRTNLNGVDVGMTRRKM